ncbi:MAG: hydantoinase/oxoprolinase family protein [Methanobacteriaceae archaeon]
MKVAGFDIGGANTDLAIIDFNEEGNFNKIISDFAYLPMWYKNNELSQTLLKLINDNNNNSNADADINNDNNYGLDDIDAIGICMTAELVDAYETKVQGVMEIAKDVFDTFTKKYNIPVVFVSLNGIIDYETLKSNPLDVAAANWIATAEIAKEISPNCVMIDTGSTTTDIIPIKNGKECSKGRTDFERLKTSELIYTGTLRTNLASIYRPSNKISFCGEDYHIASELFAITGDVFNVLSKIKTSDYSCDTPDGMGKSKKDSMHRIARVLCADLDILSEKDISEIAESFYKNQVLEIAEGIKEVASREKLDTVVCTGLGLEILNSKAAELAGLNLKKMTDILTKDECTVAPAIGTAILTEDFIKNSMGNGNNN